MAGACPGARPELAALDGRSARARWTGGRAYRATRRAERACGAGTPPRQARAPEGLGGDPPTEQERHGRRQRRLANDRSPATRNPECWLPSQPVRSVAEVPRHSRRSRPVAVDAELKSLRPRGDGVRDRREAGRGLLESLALEIHHAPSPVRGARGREGEDVYGVPRPAATHADAAIMRRISIAAGSPGGEAAVARSAGGAPRF